MITSAYPIKTNIKLLYTLIGLQPGRIKCLTQTWNMSQSLYIMKTVNKQQLVSAFGCKRKHVNTITSAISNTAIYASTLLFWHSRLLFSTMQSMMLRIENFPRNQNNTLKISRIKPAFQQGLTPRLNPSFSHPSFQYLQNPHILFFRDYITGGGKGKS